MMSLYRETGQASPGNSGRQVANYSQKKARCTVTLLQWEVRRSNFPSKELNWGLPGPIIKIQLSLAHTHYL